VGVRDFTADSARRPVPGAPFTKGATRPWSLICTATWSSKLAASKASGLVGAYCELVGHGYKIHRIAATSAGAIVGALIAGFRLDELEKTMRSIDYRNFEDKVSSTVSAPATVRRNPERRGVVTIVTEDLQIWREERPSEILAKLAATLDRRQLSPWAVIAVAFKDDPADLPALDLHRRLFTGAGTGHLNMVDFFHDMSHGKIDTSGTEVFGWYRLDVNRDTYVGNVYPQPAGKLNRDGLLAAGKAKAVADGVQLNDFDGVVVCGYADAKVGTDLCGWLGGMAALCDQNSLQPSLLGQEMGHGYGLDHARRDGSADDYQDPWDVMSTAAWPAMEADNADFTKVGPGLNAWNMRGREWLDERRVWSGQSNSAFDVTIDLRPLHRHDLPGYLAAELGPYLVEFRIPERWDAAIPRACVLVHRFEDNHSYLMSGDSGNPDLVEGQQFRDGEIDFPYVHWFALDVTRLDTTSRTATIRLQHRPLRSPPQVGPGIPLGGIEVDGGGILILNGKVIRVPPRGPAASLAKELARYLDTDLSPGADVAAALAQRRHALTNVMRAAGALYADTAVVSEAPPGFSTAGAAVDGGGA